MIQLWRSENGFSIDGITYYLPDVDGATVTVNERKHLTRGANSTNKKGFVYKENSKQASTIVFDSVNVPAEIAQILKDAYNNETRMDVFCIDNVTGESISAKDCILTTYFQQTNVTEGEDTYNVDIEFETFNLK